MGPHMKQNINLPYLFKEFTQLVWSSTLCDVKMKHQIPTRAQLYSNLMWKTHLLSDPADSSPLKHATDTDTRSDNNTAETEQNLQPTHTHTNKYIS